LSWRGSRSETRTLLCRQSATSCRAWRSKRRSHTLQQQQQLGLLQVLQLLRVVARLQQPEAGRAALVLLVGLVRHRPRQLLLSLLLLRAKVKDLMMQAAAMREIASRRSRAQLLPLLLQLLAEAGPRRL
jgi:hypothetical protein